MVPSLEPLLLDDAHAVVLEVIGRSGSVSHIEPLQIRDDAAVLLATTSGGGRLVVKLAPAQTDFQ
jgi:hypothetical protein